MWEEQLNSFCTLQALAWRTSALECITHKFSHQGSQDVGVVNWQHSQLWGLEKREERGTLNTFDNARLI